MSEAIQIAVAVVLTATLGAVLWYASEARKQAEANAEMAREMREQTEASLRLAEEAKRARQDDVRPVLDVRKITPVEFGTGDKAFSDAVIQRLSNSHVWCALRNFGKGPALNVKAHVLQEDLQEEQDLGALTLGEATERRAFAVRDGFVEARYEDVYGRQFYSRRPASFDEEGTHLGDLQTGQIR